MFGAHWCAAADKVLMVKDDDRSRRTHAERRRPPKGKEAPADERRTLRVIVRLSVVATFSPL